MKAPVGWRTRARLAAQVSKDIADARLVTAYQNVFGRSGEDTEMVLADLATHCGFYNVASRGGDTDLLNYDEGRRSAFARIWNFLNLSDAQLAALEQASRDEAASASE